MTEFFEKPVLSEPALTKDASHISHIYYGRKNASKFFFQLPGIRKNRKLWDDLRTISESFRMLQGYQLTVEVLKQAYQDAQAKTAKYSHDLRDLVSKTAVSYVTLKYPNVSADAIIKGAEENNPEVKDEVTMACKL